MRKMWRVEQNTTSSEYSITRGVNNSRGRRKTRVVSPVIGQGGCPGREPDCLNLAGIWVGVSARMYNDPNSLGDGAKEGVTIWLGLKHVFHFPSQICVCCFVFILQGRLIAPFFVRRFCSCSGLLLRIPRPFCVRGVLRIFIERKLSNFSALLVLSPVNM